MSGFLISVHKLFDDSLATVQNRVELFGLELREEKWRFIQTVILVLAVCFLAMMAVLLLTAAILFSVREETRPYAATGLCAGNLLGAGWALRVLRKRFQSEPTAFSDTIDQLRKDREWLASLK